MLGPAVSAAAISNNHARSGAARCRGKMHGIKSRTPAMDYEHGSPEHEAFWNGYRQATNHELGDGQSPKIPSGYSESQFRAWEQGKWQGYQDS
jgi:hypothetical protein